MRNLAFLLLTTLLLLLLFLLGCSATIKKEVPSTAPFTAAEAEYIRTIFWGSKAGSLASHNDPRMDIESDDIKKMFLNPHLQNGWLDGESHVLRAMKPAVVESLRNHPKEVLPILVSGWENGWKNYPWNSQTLPPFWLVKNNRNLLNLIICLDPKEAERLLIKAFNSLPNNGKEIADESFYYRTILTILYGQIHSPRWKDLLKPIAERELHRHGFGRLYVMWCAQENEKDGLPLAETFLKEIAKEHDEDGTVRYQSIVYELKGDVEGLKALCKKYQNLKFKISDSNPPIEYNLCDDPLMALMFMKRDDVVTDFAKGNFSPELKKTASYILLFAKKWREKRDLDPCECSISRRYGYEDSEDTIVMQGHGMRID